MAPYVEVWVDPEDLTEGCDREHIGDHGTAADVLQRAMQDRHDNDGHDGNMALCSDEVCSAYAQVFDTTAPRYHPPKTDLNEPEKKEDT